MSNPIIKVNNLSKRYRIGVKEHLQKKHPDDKHIWGYLTLGEALINGITAPVRNLMKLRKLTEFKDNPSSNEEEDVIWALKDISFEINKGEVVGIIGRNGAGKSTLLKILSRITEPTSGSIEIYGRVSSLLEVGTGFHPELTGRENIFLNGAVLGMRKLEIEEKFDEIVAFAEIEKFLDTPVKRYSSGMYTRLAFAVAAHLEPDILLVDEVLAVGDVQFQKKCLGKMGDVAKEGRTVLFISHNMPSIMKLCQRVILLDTGKIVLDGRSTEVVQHYTAMARSAGGEVVWPDTTKAPGNNIVRLYAVRILQEGVNSPTVDVDISKDVLIQILFLNLREGTKLYSALILKDQIGVPILASSNHKSVSLTEDSWNGRPPPKGLFQSVCRIPGNFLNNGLYSVSVFVGRGISDAEASEEDVISFYVHDTGEMCNECFGSWDGLIIRPRLAWRSEFLGNSIPKPNK